MHRFRQTRNLLETPKHGSPGTSERTREKSLHTPREPFRTEPISGPFPVSRVCVDEPRRLAGRGAKFTWKNKNVFGQSLAAVPKSCQCTHTRRRRRPFSFPELCFGCSLSRALLSHRTRAVPKLHHTATHKALPPNQLRHLQIHHAATPGSLSLSHSTHLSPFLSRTTSIPKESNRTAKASSSCGAGWPGWRVVVVALWLSRSPHPIHHHHTTQETQDPVQKRKAATASRDLAAWLCCCFCCCYCSTHR